MATIGKIRQRSGLVIFLIGAAIVLFLISDSFSNNSALFGDGPITSVGEIAGDEVSADYYKDLVARYEQNAKNSQNTRELSPEQRMQVNNQAWESVINERILGSEYGELGLSVGAEELNDMAYGRNVHSYFTQIPTFQNEQKQYDPNKVRQFIDNFDNLPDESREIWNGLIEDVRLDRMRTKYLAMISKGVYVTGLEAKEDYFGQNKNANFTFVRLKTADVGDSLYDATEAEVRAYARENDIKYQQDERSIQYVTFSIDPSAKDTQNTITEVQNIRKDFALNDNASGYARLHTDGSMMADEFMGITELSENGSFPGELTESVFTADLGTVFEPVYDAGTYKIVKVVAEEPIEEEDGGYYRAAHILIKPDGDTDADTATAMAEARKILAQAKSGEKTFEELAKEHGTDGTKDQGGDLGWWKKGGMVANFQKGVESMSTVGEYTISKSRFGAHIIKLTHAPLFVKRKVVVIEKQILASAETGEEAYSNAAQFIDLAKTGSEFLSTASELGLNINIAENIKVDASTVKGLNDARQLVRWAYEQEGVDAVSDIVTLDQNYVVAMLTEIRAKGELDVITREGEIKDKIIKEKKVKDLQEKMQGVYTEDLEALATSLGVSVESAENASFKTPVIPNLGSETKVMGAIFALKDGEVSKVIVGDEGVYVFKMDGYTEVEAPTSYADMQNKLLQSASAGSQVYALQALKDDANVVDRRYNFY